MYHFFLTQYLPDHNISLTTLLPDSCRQSRHLLGRCHGLRDVVSLHHVRTRDRSMRGVFRRDSITTGLDITSMGTAIPTHLGTVRGRWDHLSLHGRDRKTRVFFFDMGQRSPRRGVARPDLSTVFHVKRDGPVQKSQHFF